MSITATVYATGLKVAGASLINVFASNPGELWWAAREYPDRVEPVQTTAGEWRASISVPCGDSIMLPPGGYRIEATDYCGESRGLVRAEYIWGGPADYNADGVAGDDLDIENFWQCLAGNCCPVCTSDVDHDGDSGVDADIARFYELLAGHAE